MKTLFFILDSVRWWMAGVFLFLSFAMILKGGRFYPLSDFPMFALAKRHLAATFLACSNRITNEEMALPARVHAPLSRWWIEQITYQVGGELLDYSWLRPIVWRAKTHHPDCVEFRLVRAHFQLGQDGFPVVDWETAFTRYRVTLGDRN